MNKEPEKESDSPDIQALITSPNHPTLDEILALAKERNITDSGALWELFDYIRKEWIEQRLG